MAVPTFNTSTPTSIDGFTAPWSAHQQTMIGTSLPEYLEAVDTFRNRLIHGVLQITMHSTSHCVLHQCLSQGICSCTCSYRYANTINKVTFTQQQHMHTQTQCARHAALMLASTPYAREALATDMQCSQCTYSCK